MLPNTTKAIVVAEAFDNSQLPYDARLVEQSIPELKENELLIRMEAVAFNHRDVCSVSGGL